MSRTLTIPALLCVLAGTTLSTTATKCCAQWVDISRHGGVYVRAPFVRVHVDPYGGTFVRAPFTIVDVPRRGYPYAPHPVIIEQPSLPRAQGLVAMDDETLWRCVMSTADRLYKRLGRFNTGASWQAYLRLPEKVLNDSSSSSAERRDALTTLLERFRYVATEPRYRKIANLSTFTGMQAALTEVKARLDTSWPAGDVPIEELPLPLPEPE